MVGAIVVAKEVPSVSSFAVPATSKCLLITFPHFAVLVAVPGCSRNVLWLLPARWRCTVRSKIYVLCILGGL
jgi:hypothetical protein